MAWRGLAAHTRLPLGLPPTQYMVEQVCCCDMQRAPCHKIPVRL